MNDTETIISILIMLFGTMLIGAGLAIRNFEYFMFGITLLLVSAINFNSIRISKLEANK